MAGVAGEVELLKEIKEAAWEVYFRGQIRVSDAEDQEYFERLVNLFGEYYRKYEKEEGGE